MKIRPLTKEHWPEVAKIFNDGIATKQATFRDEVPSWNDWNATHHKHSRIVVVD